MRGKVWRTGIAVLGVLAALVWSALFLANPRVSLELLVLFAPVVTPIWLITMLTRAGGNRRVRPSAPPARAKAVAGDARAAVLARDGGRCGGCGRAAAAHVVARRPARRGDAETLERFVSLCRDCAAVTPLAGGQ